MAQRQPAEEGVAWAKLPQGNLPLEQHPHLASNAVQNAPVGNHDALHQNPELMTTFNRSPKVLLPEKAHQAWNASTW